MENLQSNTKTPKLKLDFKDSKYATGRRKTSIAKVWLKKGSGKIYVNGKLYNEYFADEIHKKRSSYIVLVRDRRKKCSCWKISDCCIQNY